jgi:pyrimidine deaminase RibD-like protein
MTTSNETHLKFLSRSLNEARKSPPKPSNFRVGCVIVSFKREPATILSTGYTLELPGNTHAEQCALSKLGYSELDSSSRNLSPELHAVLYTTLEPCGKRLSGKTTCVQRIIATQRENPGGGVRKVIFGAKEPGTFVQDSQSCRLLTEAGIEWEYVEGLEEEILKVAMEGHQKDQEPSAGSDSKAEEAKEEESRGTNVDNISPEERKRQEELPRNPKKRMMDINAEPPSS